MDPTDLVPGYGYPPTPEEQEDLLIIARELLRAVAAMKWLGVRSPRARPEISGIADLSPGVPP